MVMFIDHCLCHSLLCFLRIRFYSLKVKVKLDLLIKIKTYSCTQNYSYLLNELDLLISQTSNSNELKQNSHHFNPSSPYAARECQRRWPFASPHHPTADARPSLRCPAAAECAPSGAMRRRRAATCSASRDTASCTRARPASLWPARRPIHPL